MKDVALDRKIWAKMRYYKTILGISDETFSEQLEVCDKTIHTYDKDASNMRLQQIESFLKKNDLNIEDLIK